MDRTAYEELADRYADQYGVDRSLFRRLIQQESGFDPNAVSRVGAIGLGQVMPATAADPGHGVTPLAAEDLMDPEKNLRFSAEYLSAMLNKFDGDPRLGLAAYNAGAGAVAKYGDIPPFEETQNYVAKILGSEELNATRPQARPTDSLAPSTSLRPKMRPEGLGDEQAANKSFLDELSDSMAYLDASQLGKGARRPKDMDLGARIEPGRAGGGARALKRLGLASLV